MAYDETLAARVRDCLAGRAGVTEKKMFGGLTFMLGGNMCCGVNKDDLFLRVGAEAEPEALRNAHARPCDFTGRPMRGMIMVAPAGYGSDADLRRWIALAEAYAAYLPAK